MSPQDPAQPGASDPRDRQRWLATLSQAPVPLLLAHAADWSSWPVVVLRPAETGLVMLRGRIGGSGDRFNLGEATVTRCVLRCGGEPQSTVGVGYVLGRQPAHAHAVALFDGLLQQPVHQQRLLHELFAPLAESLARRQAADAARAATSRVHFATLQPEAAR